MKFKHLLLSSAFVALSCQVSASEKVNMPQIGGEEMQKAQEMMQKKSADAFHGWMMAKDSMLAKPRMNFENIPVPDGVMPEEFLVQNLLDANKKAVDLKNNKPQPKMKVFVSLSMPQASFDSYMKQVRQIGNGNVTFVIQGLLEENNLKKTVAKIREISKGELVFEVDPSSFKRFNVTQVPAFVLYEDDPNKEAMCAQKGLNPDEVIEDHIGVYGDVTLKFAMENLVSNKPDFKYISFLEQQLEKLKYFN